MLNHNMKDLGVFVSIFAEAGYLEHAQEYLNELQERLNTMQGMKRESTAAKMQANELLAELPMVETKEPVLKYEPNVAPVPPVVLEELGLEPCLLHEAEEWVGKAVTPVPEPEGIIRDKDGKVTHVSVQAGNLGYDPEIHENTVLKIYCDGKHIENAHTANTVAGLVLYYKKNEQGRIKTLELHGEVEIRGLEQ